MSLVVEPTVRLNPGRSPALDPQEHHLNHELTGRLDRGGSVSLASVEARRADFLSVGIKRNDLLIEQVQRWVENQEQLSVLSTLGYPTALVEVAADRAHISGDFCRIEPLKDGRFAVFVGDVEGHGEEAAWVSNLIGRLTSRGNLWVTDANRLVSLPELLENRGPAEALGELESGLKSATDRIVAMGLTVIEPDTGVCRCARAGLPWIAVVRANGDAAVVPAEGTIMGVALGTQRSEAEVTLGLGDRLVMMTDGLADLKLLPESAKSFPAFEGSPLCNVVLERPQILHTSVPGVYDFSRGMLNKVEPIIGIDDLTLLTLQRAA